MTPTDQQPKVPERNLRFGYWVATHRSLLTNIHIAFWGFVAASMMILFFVVSFDWLVHMKETRLIYESLTPERIHFEAIEAPKEIIVHRAQSIMYDDTTIQTLAHIQNGNDKWGVIAAEYEVLVGGVSAGKETITMAPGQELFLVKQNIPFSGTTLPPVQVVFHDVKWQRIPDTSLLPLVEWYIPPDSYSFRYIDSTSEIVYQSEASFELQNKSVYGFRGPQVVIMLKDSAGVIQAVRSLNIDEITSLEKRSLVFRWPKRVSRSLTPDIRVNTDILSEDRIVRTIGKE